MAETIIEKIEKNSVNIGYGQVRDLYNEIYGARYDFSDFIKEAGNDMEYRQAITNKIYTVLHKEMEQAHKEVENVVMNNGEFSTDYNNPSDSTEIADIHPDLDPKKETFLVEAFKGITESNITDARKKGYRARSDNKYRTNNFEEILEEQKQQEMTYINELNQYASSLIKSLSKTEISVEQEQSILNDFITKSSNDFQSNPYDAVAFSITKNAVNEIKNNLNWDANQIDQFIYNISHTGSLDKQNRNNHSENNNEENHVAQRIRQRKEKRQQNTPNAP